MLKPLLLALALLAVLLAGPGWFPAADAQTDLEARVAYLESVALPPYQPIDNTFIYPVLPEYAFYVACKGGPDVGGFYKLECVRPWYAGPAE